MQLKVEDILFFIIIALMIFVALCLLKGSPTLMTAIISVALFAASSDLLLWRKLFEVDKNAAVAFTKLKSDIGNINNKLEDIKNLIKSK